MGDATNFVVVFAGELLKQAEYLLKMGIHPSEVVDGFDVASKKALEILPTLVAGNCKNPLDRAEMSKAVRTAIASKQYGYNIVFRSSNIISSHANSQFFKFIHCGCSNQSLNSYEDMLTNVVLDAVAEVMPKKNPGAFNVDSVRVVKILGGSVLDTAVVKGMVFGREPEGKYESDKSNLIHCIYTLEFSSNLFIILVSSPSLKHHLQH